MDKSWEDLHTSRLVSDKQVYKLQELMASIRVPVLIFHVCANNLKSTSVLFKDHIVI